MEQINGFNIVASFNFPARRYARPGRVILVKRDEYTFQPWVVAVQYANDYGDCMVYDNEWSGGNYWGEFHNAFRCFNDKVLEQFPDLVELELIP